MNASSQAHELGLQIRVLGPHGRPGGRDQSGFEPGEALRACAGGAAFTGTFVVPRDTSSPRRLPLLYVLGASFADDPVTFPVEGIDGGSVSMLGVRLG